MRLRELLVIAMSIALWSLTASVQAAEKLETVASLPAGLSKEIAAAVDPKGQTVVGKEGAVCSVWLVKELPIKANFKPTLNVKYPFAPGELIGVLQVQAKSKFTDFRGQEIKPGVFTLRYSQQPEDGNQIGRASCRERV